MKEAKNSIIFVDDHEILLQGLSALAERMGMIVLGTAKHGDEALDLIKEVGSPEFIVLDIEMEGGKDGLTTAAILRKRYPDLKILILSMHKEYEFVIRTLKLGVNAYVLKDSGSYELEKAIMALRKGEKYVDAKMAAAVATALSGQEKEKSLLSAREIEIIKFIAEEYTTKQIAEKLSLSKHTVETHRKNILLKLDLKNTAGLVRYAFRKGIVR